MKGMEQLELHDGQLAGVSILAAKGSHLGDGPGGFAVCNMCGKERFASHTTGHATGFAVCNLHVWGGTICLSYHRTCDCFVDLDIWRLRH